MLGDPQEGQCEPKSLQVPRPWHVGVATFHRQANPAVARLHIPTTPCAPPQYSRNRTGDHQCSHWALFLPFPPSQCEPLFERID